MFVENRKTFFSNMDDRLFFDKISETWDANEVMSTPEKVRAILRLADVRPGEKILDLGTGTGILIPYLAEMVGNEGEITAVDYSEGMLSKAKEKYSNITPQPEFINLDFENETIDGEFDKIILYCVYPHLHQPIETLKWLRRVNLREGGEIYIGFPCKADFINSIHKERHSESDLLPSAEELVNILHSEGFSAEVIDGEYLVRISG